MQHAIFTPFAPFIPCKLWWAEFLAHCNNSEVLSMPMTMLQALFAAMCL